MFLKFAMHTATASLLALGLSLLLMVLPVAAATWADPVRVATGLGYAGPSSAELVPLKGSTAVVGYLMSNGEDIDRVVVSRTNDSGRSWTKPTLVTDHGWAPSTAGRGTDVDVAWTWNQRVYYAHSGDMGSTFDDEIPLSPVGKHAFRPSVGRGPDGLVAVVWDQEGVVRARVSTDDGSSFAPAVTVAQRGFFPKIAVGNGVVYVLYAHGEFDTVRVVRSLDAGATWGPRFNAGILDSASYSITAEGSRAYIAYESSSSDNYWALSYRGTSDSGATWSQARQLIPSGWSGYMPIVSLRNGIVRAVFVPCQAYDDYCGDSGRVFYRQSSDGVHWTTPERVSQKWLYSEPVAVGFAGKPIVLYQANATPYFVPVLFARTRAN